MAPPRTFPIRYSRLSRLWLESLRLGFLLARPKVELTGEVLRVRWGWVFRAMIPRQSIRRVALDRDRRWTKGVHSDLRFRSWLVSPSWNTGFVFLDILPPAKGRSGPFLVTVERLGLGVEDPDAFLRDLGAHSGVGRGTGGS
jgi:hypothetical protein